jgi:hypothetical protein
MTNEWKSLNIASNTRITMRRPHKNIKCPISKFYSWTTKYETDGIEALQDKRGKRKTVDKMSEVEKLRAQNTLLEAKNKRQQMEIDFLKKLEEIERRRS